MGFDEFGLSAPILAAVGDMGFIAATTVQQKVIPLVLAGRDVMATAQTGTGKTAAYVLPLFDRLGSTTQIGAPRVLILVPTRELAMQISDVCATVCKYTHNTQLVVVGGVGYESQRRALRHGCDVLVATPGRLVDLVDNKSCNLANVRTLVLDEADRMLEMGFLPNVQGIVGKMPKLQQTLLFSATLSKEVVVHTKAFVHDPVFVEVSPSGTMPGSIEHYVVWISPEARKRVLVQVLKREGARRVIVFVRGRHRADHVGRILRNKGFRCASMHGNMPQHRRNKVLGQFERGEVDVLVATDVLARGIDIEGVSYVVNMDVPDEATNYVHRIGRTGRAGHTGWTLTLCDENDVTKLRAIERRLGERIPEFTQTEGLDVGEHPFVLKH